MNQANVELVREIITELVSEGDIMQGYQGDAHYEIAYKDSDAFAGQQVLDMGGWITENECGTAACVAGFLCLDERIQARGLHLGYNQGGPFPAYSDRTHMNALKHFLDFSFKGANHVFGPNNPNTFASARERLACVVALGGLSPDEAGG